MFKNMKLITKSIIAFLIVGVIPFIVIWLLGVSEDTGVSILTLIAAALVYAAISAAVSL
ncbi:MAG: hypothetical protein GY757_34710, partial [bacterium]|nr:hypothetical protein [bacterium]